MQIKYSEVQVGQEFILKGERYTRLPHFRALCILKGTYVSIKKHELVECENPYAELRKGKVMTEDEIKLKRAKALLVK